MAPSAYVGGLWALLRRLAWIQDISLLYFNIVVGIGVFRGIRNDYMLLI